MPKKFYILPKQINSNKIILSPEEARHKVLKYLLIFSFFVLVLTFLIFPVTDLDIWMHLVSGKYILENFKIPQSEFYSYTAFGKPWIDHEWLSQVIFYIFYQVGSYNGLIILRVIIFLLIFSLFFLILAKKTNCFLAVLACLVTLFISHDRFFLRPEVFTLLFTVIYIYILEENSEGKLINANSRELHADSRRYNPRLFALDSRVSALKFNSLYLLPILQVFWVNMHGYFLLGIIIPLLFLIGQLFSPEPSRRANLPTLFKLVLLIMLVTFINPYTYKGAIYPFTTLFSSLSPQWRSILKAISELKSPFLAGSPTLFWFKFLIFASIVSFLLSIWAKTLKVSRLLVYLLFLIIGITVKRHQTLFAFAVILITVYNLREIFINANIRQSNADKRGFFNKSIGDNWRVICDYLRSNVVFQKLFLPLKILFLFLGIIYFAIFTQQIITNRFYLKNHILKTFDLGLTPELFPEKAVDFIVENNFKGNIFNDMIGGSYLVWRYYPLRKVFLDGRTEVYGPQVFKDYLTSFRMVHTFDDVAKKYNINYILINYSLGGRGKLTKYLLENKDWAVVYFDQTALVFIKNIPENKNIIDKFSLDLNEFNNPNHPLWAKINETYKTKRWFKPKAFPYSFLKPGYLFLDLEYPQLAETPFKKAMELNPDFDLPYSGLGNTYSQQKLYPQALQFYALALSKNPDTPEVYYHMARIYEKQSLRPQAEKYYQKSIKLNPYSIWSRYDLAFLYFNQKKFSPAIKHLKKALRINPAFGEGYRILGACLANKGELLAAKINFQKAIQFIPDDAQLHFNLGMVLEGIGKFNAAINEFREVLKLNPLDLESRHHLAISYLSVGSTLKAQEQWLIIKKQDPDNKLAKEFLKKLERLGYEYAHD